MNWRREVGYSRQANGPALRGSNRESLSVTQLEAGGTRYTVQGGPPGILIPRHLDSGLSGRFF